MKIMLSKALVFGIIAFLIGASVIPSISGTFRFGNGNHGTIFFPEGVNCISGKTFEFGGVDDPTIIRINIKFPEPIITPSEILSVNDKELYYHVEMNGMASVANPGDPVLPVKGVKILLPFNREIKDCTVEPGKKIDIPGFYQIEPRQKEYPLSFKGEREKTLPNRETYESDTVYPIDHVSKLPLKQVMKGYNVAIAHLYPIEYQPLSGKISYYREMTLVVNTNPTPERNLAGIGELFKKNEIKQRIRDLDQDRQRLFKYVDNPQTMLSYQGEEKKIESLKSKEVPSLPGTKAALDNYQYVIITKQEFVDAFQPLIDSKINKGLTATTVTTEWIYANYNGTTPYPDDDDNDNATKIRNFIVDAYNNWSTEYVLLGGDGDGADVGGESGDNIVPSRGLQDGEPGDDIVDDNIPSDLYYACLDGTFDYDADGIYGEKTDGIGGGEIDLLAEVYVGRAPVDSIYEVNNFVNKTLSYENSASDYLRRVYLVEDEGCSSCANTLEAIRLGSDSYGTVGFSSNPFFNVTTLYDYYTPWTKQDIINIINSNIHIIHHHGHGGCNNAMKMNNDDVDDLNNNEFFFMYTGACYSGSFDNRGTSTYRTRDCIAEHFTTEPNGTFAFIGPTRYGYGGVNNYEVQFWDAVLGEGILNLGKAHQDSKEDNLPSVHSGRMRWSYLTLNLFGDPEVSFHHSKNHISNLSSNWNLICLPYNQTISITDLIVSYNGTYYNWTQATNPMCDPIVDPIVDPNVYGWNRSLDMYVPATTLEAGYGYWMYAYDDCELWIQDISVNPDDYITELEVTWNAIGIPLDVPMDISELIVHYDGTYYNWTEATDPVNGPIVDPNVYGWSRILHMYVPVADTLEPGYAYWMYAYQNCTLRRS